VARTRRKLRQEDLAHQIGRARATVVALEKGSPSTEIGAYVAALWALGLLQELDLVADPVLVTRISPELKDVSILPASRARIIAWFDPSLA